jgi:TonB family protein
MYFNLEDHRPDTPTIPRPMSGREVVLITVNLHLVLLLVIVFWPELPFVKALEAKRQQQLEERERELEEEQKNARFVFVQPKLDVPAPKPPPVADLSDVDRRARTVERAPNPTNRLPFARGNSPERVEAQTPEPPQRSGEPAAQPNEPEAPPAPKPSALMVPDTNLAALKPVEPDDKPGGGPTPGVLSDAIRNVQKYAQKESFSNLQGGGVPEIAPSIQFDTKGVEFGPWLRRFVAQIRRNWFIPYAAMTMRGHVVVTFYVHKDGRITDVSVAKPSGVDAFTLSARNAILTSNPTVPLPPEYPDDRAFFTVTFYFNENPGAP